MVFTVDNCQTKQLPRGQNKSTLKREVKTMSNSKSSINVPESKGALDNMKYEVARELGVNLSKGYNGNLTAKENGQIGGQMVKKMIEDYERQAGQGMQ